MIRQQFSIFVTTVFCLVCLTGCDPQLQTTNPAVQSAEAPSLDKEIEEVKAQIKALEERLQKLNAEREKMAVKAGSPVKPPQNAFTTGNELLANLPVDAYPKLGAKFQIERVATLKWIEKNVVGSVVTWEETVTGVNVTGAGPFFVSLKTKGAIRFGFLIDHPMYGALGEAFVLSDTKCQVMLAPVNGVTSLSYDGCTVEEAKKLREFEGQTITLRASVVDPDLVRKAKGRIFLQIEKHEVGFALGDTFQFFGDRRDYIDDGGDGILRGKKVELLPIKLVVSPPEINGFLPEQMKSITRKSVSQHE